MKTDCLFPCQDDDDDDDNEGGFDFTAVSNDATQSQDPASFMAGDHLNTTAGDGLVAQPKKVTVLGFVCLVVLMLKCFVSFDK